MKNEKQLDENCGPDMSKIRKKLLIAITNICYEFLRL